MPKGVAIKRDTPKLGSKFEKKWKKKTYVMTVVEQNGSVKFKVGNKIFNSPTAAAKSITECSVNGWKFWEIQN